MGRAFAKLAFTPLVKAQQSKHGSRQQIRALRVPGERSPAERVILLHIEAFDWNCPQHITPRFTEAEIDEALKPLHRRIADLEAEVDRLRHQPSPAGGA